MTSQIRGYLTDLGRHLHLEARDERDILTEIRDHIKDSAQDLMDEGIPSNDAFSSAIDSLGGPKRIARQMYQVHSQGSWYHTALAVLPHILLSLLFAFGLWTSPGWFVALLIAAVVISIYGWKRGRPNWTYPWLGYTLVAPIVSWGLAMSAVGYGAWGVLTEGSLPLGSPIYIASFVYVAISLWIVIRIVTRVAQRDWVMASMAVLPVPFLIYWFIFFYQEQTLSAIAGGARSQGVEASAAIVFLILAAATALFFRIGRRVVRVGLLLVTVPSMFILAWFSYQGGVGYMALFTVSALSLGVVLGPALLDLRSSDEAAAPTDFAKEQS